MVSGFSIIKNGDSLGYPYCEALRSLAPFVSEIVVAHGDSTDNTAKTLAALQNEISVPLRIVLSPWDALSVKLGQELSRQTNVALDACRFDICFYIQADEVLNEVDSAVLREDLARFESDSSADAMALRWIHFYGNFDTVIESRRWYRREIRVIKRSRRLRSFGDAQGFRIRNPFKISGNDEWTKPRAALSRAHMLHYGWVRPPEVMVKKTEALDRLWHGPGRDGSHSKDKIYPKLFGMKPFRGEHPKIMQPRIEASRTSKPVEYSGEVPLKDRLRLGFDRIIENATGLRLGEFKNYSSLKHY